MFLSASGYLIALYLLFQGASAPSIPLNSYLSLDPIEESHYEDLIRQTYAPPAETLSFVINAGEVLIFNLPASIEGRQIEFYQLEKSPALSWLTGRSFFWRTLAKDTGKHEIRLSGYRDGVAAEDLLIEVDIR